MYHYIKEYRVSADLWRFIFSTNEDVGFDFDITNVGDLEHGFEDQDELTIYPSEIEITIDDMSDNNYTRFKQLLASYNKTYPFNFGNVLTLTIQKNNNEKFRGILFSAEYDFKGTDEYIKLTWTSASEKLKSISFGNPAVLNKLYEANLISRTEVWKIPQGVFVGYVYGYTNAAVLPIGGVPRLQVNGPQLGGTNPGIYNLIHSLYKLINPNIEIDVNLDWLFGSQNYNINQLYILGIFRYVTGRWFAKKESVYVAGLEPRWVRHQDAIIDGENWSSWWDSDGNEGVPDRKINEALKFLARNFGCITGMTSFNRAYFKKRFYNNTNYAIDLTDSAISIRKETFLRKKIMIKINDEFARTTAVRGSDIYGLDEEDRLEYSIKLSSYRDNTFSGYNLFVPPDQGVFGVTDPTINYQNSLSEVLAELEWRTRRNNRDKIIIENFSTDLEFNQIYKYNDKGNYIYLRPMRMQEKLFDNTTIIEGVEAN